MRITRNPYKFAPPEHIWVRIFFDDGGENHFVVYADIPQKESIEKLSVAAAPHLSAHGFNVDIKYTYRVVFMLLVSQNTKIKTLARRGEEIHIHADSLRGKVFSTIEATRTA